MTDTDKDWTDKLPEEPGPYWFYGWFHGQQRHDDGEPIEPRLDFVNVYKGQNCMIYFCAVEMQYTRNIRAIGKWRPMVLPQLPDLSELLSEEEN